MGTFLVGSFVVLAALSSSCAAENRPLPCEEEKVKVLKDLAGIQREAGQTLKEMAQTQRKVDQCQTLASTELDKLEERIDRVLDTSLALNRPVEGRFQDLEAKVDTQADEMKKKLQTMQVSYEHQVETLQTLAESNKESLIQGLGVIEAKVDTQVDKLDSRLQAIEDRLSAMQVETLQTLEQRSTELGLSLNNSLESLGQRLGVIEARVDTQENKTNQLEANHASYKEELQPIKDTLKANQEQLTKVASRRAFLQSCERVGGDCVHFHDVEMSWDDARRYCQGLGGDLLEPADKTGVALDGLRHPMSEPHSPLFDFLHRKRKSLGKIWLEAWVGASVDGDGNKATWTSGQSVPASISLDPRECIAVDVYGSGTFGTWSYACGSTFYPLCH